MKIALAFIIFSTQVRAQSINEKAETIQSLDF